MSVALHTRAPHRQRGMVLVTSLLLLVVVTILAVGMFRSFGTDEKIAGNTREKQRALNAAETAEQYAESWLAAGNGGTPVACTAPVSYTVGQVCITPMSIANGNNPAVLPWTLPIIAYAPPSMTVSNVITAGTYYNSPQYYIAYLGSATIAGNLISYYQIDAAGYGGNANTAAVVEATYIVTSKIGCKTC